MTWHHGRHVTPADLKNRPGGPARGCPKLGHYFSSRRTLGDVATCMPRHSHPSATPTAAHPQTRCARHADRSPSRHVSSRRNSFGGCGAAGMGREAGRCGPPLCLAPHPLTLHSKELYHDPVTSIHHLIIQALVPERAGAPVYLSPTEPKVGPTPRVGPLNSTWGSGQRMSKIGSLF